MRSGLMPVTVTGIDVEIGQLGILPQFVGQELGELAEQAAIDFREYFQTALALEGVEVKRDFRARLQSGSVGLEESPPAGAFLHHSLNAHGNPICIAHRGTDPGFRTVGEELKGGSNKIVVSG